MKFIRFLAGIMALVILAAGLIVGRGMLSSNVPHAPATAGFVLSDGENLLYEVSWTFVKIGTIRLKAHRNYTAEAYIHSYDGLPFVDLHAVHYTTMDSAFYSLGSRSIEKKENEWWGQNYLSDTTNKLLIVEETQQKDVQSLPYKRAVRDTIHLPSANFLDGLSIGYFPRLFVHTNQTIDVPTVLYGKLGTTTFHFANARTTESIDMLDKPVRVIEVKGSTTVEGIFGMTGAFTGWFSDDSAAVPIKGKLKVLIGNVNVELIQWNRSGWSPPH